MVQIRFDMTGIEYRQCRLGHQIAMIDQCQCLARLQPVRLLTIGDQINMTMIRVEFFQRTQVEAQFTVVAIAPCHVAVYRQTVVDIRSAA